MMIPSEVYTAIRNQCGETEVTFWTEAEVYSLISTAESKIAQKIGIIEQSTAITSVTGTQTYSIGSYVSGTLTRVTWDSYRVLCVDINDFDELEGKAYGGVDLEGYPTHYYRYGDSLGFTPTPDDAKEIKMYYRESPVVITTASSGFSIPEEYTDYLSDYPLYRMMLKDQELRTEALAYKAQWDENLKEVEENWNKRKFTDRAPTVKVYEALVED